MSTNARKYKLPKNPENANDVLGDRGGSSNTKIDLESSMLTADSRSIKNFWLIEDLMLETRYARIKEELEKQ